MEGYEMKEEHFCLFPRRIPGFALREKEWLMFDVEHLKEIDWRHDTSDLKSRLKLPEEDINCILGLVQPPKIRDGKEILSARGQQVDDIPGKGAGKSFLLHGQPGTGKTYTAECVSELVRKPLLHLTAADIGVETKEMEAALVEWFVLAERWSAIILLDEADAFFDQRKPNMAQRNSLVCAFLRRMEYFRGTLFLTTNMPGNMDEAIVARIQVPIRYLNTEESCINIWNKFFSQINSAEHADSSSDKINPAPDSEQGLKVKKIHVAVGKDAQKWALEDVRDEFKKLDEAKTQKLSAISKNESEARDDNITSTSTSKPAHARMDVFWNGREIRNALESASQQALSEIKSTKDMAFITRHHLINYKERKLLFLQYMEKIRGGLTYGETARNNKLRIDNN